MIGLQTVGSPSLWIGFVAFVLAMLAIDLGVFHRKAHAVGFREALAWSGVWVALALAFNGLVYLWFGGGRAVEFLTGYLIEKSLSVDNLFVFVVIFTAFRIPPVYQHRVLFWGILSALVLRAAMIVAGAALLERFHWLGYLLGGFLVLTGFRLLAQKGKEMRIEDQLAFRILARLIPATNALDGARFVIRREGRTLATPLLFTLLLVEVSDVVFAVDSIPAIFAVTTDPFIVFTSNIFAILGLRSLYFLLAGAADRFHYLKPGLAVVLVYIGAKMAIVDLVRIPALISLAVVAAVLGTSVAVSLAKPRPVPPRPPPG